MPAGSQGPDGLFNEGPCEDELTAAGPLPAEHVRQLQKQRLKKFSGIFQPRMYRIVRDHTKDANVSRTMHREIVEFDEFYEPVG